MLLLIIVLLLLFGGGGGYYGYSKWGPGDRPRESLNKSSDFSSDADKVRRASGGIT